MMCFRTLSYSFALLTFTATGVSAVADEIDFNRDVRPILSDKCYFCHGPDEENRQADLRLDVREEAAYTLEADGELVARIHETDPDVVMPPPETNLALTVEEKQTLERWIAAGAEYDKHWAFTVLPEAIEPPVDESGWARSPLDQFVRSTMEEQSLTPNPPAEPLRWLRRVTLDLTGLPPTTEEIAEFEADVRVDAEAAYAHAVDRLLASPAFGEHMATPWLDAARYADSYGYQSDKLNTQWPYRDWVVRALNQNLPYDEFLTWQLAGDLLENPTRDQTLATAFNRIHRLNNEGGAVFEEWRIENVADRVHTFGTVVLGLTLECSRCHDHKYDPISMRDYYSLGAFFNSIDESGVYDRTEKVPCPSMLLPTEEQAGTYKQAKAKLQVAEAVYQKAIADAKERFEHWTPTNLERPSADLRLAVGFDRAFDNSIKDIYHPSQSDRSWTSMPKLVEVTGCDVPALAPDLAADKPGAENVEPRRLAMQLDGERGVTTHGIEPFDRWAAFSVVVTLKETKRSPLRSVIAHHTRGTDCGYNGWDLTIADGHLEARLARVWPGNAISVRSTEAIPANVWHQVAATYDGSSRADGLKLFVDGRELKIEIIRDELKKSANVKVDHGGEFVIGQRFRDRGLDGGLIDDVRVYERTVTSAELVSLATGEPISPSFDYFVSAVDEPSRNAFAKLTTARKAFVMAEEAMDEIPVMRELDTPRPAHVLARGQYDAPTDDDTRVARNVPENLGLAFPENASRDRRGLAQWVTDPRHPLTARVAVNRLWANFFAAGLVGTPENFGLQGELPSHPRLLDWLARDFIENGWDVKRVCRQIVLSATYRQDSRATAESLERDPDNTFLARGPAYRLGAEQIRDLALAASGLLNPERGGPPVSPYQPGKDLWRESNGMSPPYSQSVGQSLYRRSLYSVWKRTAPLPNMLALDATTREVCTVKRSRTNTPLQALVLLNDTQFVEAARALATDVMSQTSDNPDRIEHAFVRLTGRRPNDAERAVLMGVFQDEQAHYQTASDAAAAVVGIGDAPVPEDVSPEELAAMTVVCQVILNLDATIWKR